MPKYIIALDQGTTSSRAIIFDENQEIVEIAQHELTQIYPREGWVEHDPTEIYSTQVGIIAEAVARSGINPGEVAAIGITNQRETVVVWDKTTGRPVYNAIVWQCRRTADICEDLARRGLTDYIKRTTGLLIDAYFSGTKIKWILDNVEGARASAEAGELLAGTIDSWLVYKMTGGKVHITDRTNASRTMLYDIHNLCWDERLCHELNIPMSMLPKVCSSSEIYGTYNINGTEIPIAGIAGDQQAALFGQTCFEKGEGKNTYGTGCFLLVNTGEEAVESKNGMLTTIAATTGDRVQYALEGSVFVGGAVIQWLRDELGLISDAADSEYFANKVSDTDGVFLVPAFTGLGAPYWDMYARGTIVGLTRGTGKNHIIRAALESIAYQSNAVLQAIQNDIGVRFTDLKVDGGASANRFLMQFQSDISGVEVRRPMIRETTALGAACLAGLATGVWKSLNEIRERWTLDTVFTPAMTAAERETRINGWNRAVAKACGWVISE